MSRGYRVRIALVGAVLGGMALAASWAERASPADEKAPEPRSGLRRPVALALADKGKWLFVANQRSGTVSVIDTVALKVVDEVTVGRKLSDLAVTPDGTSVVVIDEDAGELIVLRRRESKLDGPARVAVGPGPVSVQVSSDGARCFVASLWARRVTVVDLVATGGPKVKQSVSLPFPPGRQLLLPDPAKLVVADAFGGRLAVIDPGKGAVESVRELPAHNIRGLTPSADGRHLLVGHQVLSARAATSLADVHWGNLLTNNLREVPLVALRNPKADLLADSRLHHLGDVGRGAGDPAGIAVTAKGVVVLALAGVGEVAVGGQRDGAWARLAVGKRPTAVAVNPDGRHAFVANTFSDSVSVLDLNTKRVAAEVSLGGKPEPTAAERGELLFHDARLSHDGWFSCHSCHTDGHTNGLLADTTGDGSYGTPKRVPSLRGVKDTSPFGWTGGAKDLEAQVRSSVETTMRGARLTAAQEADLIAYLRTLAPPPPLNRFAEKHPTEAVRRGETVFRNQGCAACHEPPAYTSAKTFDVGLADEAGNRLFNPPSLRGVSQTGPFFHDGRARTLSDVFAKHRHGLKAELARNDLDDLLSFLADL
jgi:YVTN family beta-propeller protein